MKTAVSLPDELHARADKLARRQGKSRSEFYRDALREYLDRHETEAVTEAMNAVLRDVGSAPDPIVRHASRLMAKHTEW